MCRPLPSTLHPKCVDYIPLPPTFQNPSSEQSSISLSLVSKRRPRRSSLSVDEHIDPIIGYITSRGKFKCFDASCQDVSFGRQADFRRHYDHTHVSKKVEFYCTFDGCIRSRKPAGRSKGRSFGAREDKMREHVRTVHTKSGRRNGVKLGSTFEKVEHREITENQRNEDLLQQHRGNEAYQDCELRAGRSPYIG
jgi:hypothetical protein